MSLTTHAFPANHRPPQPAFWALLALTVALVAGADVGTVECLLAAGNLVGTWFPPPAAHDRDSR